MTTLKTINKTGDTSIVLSGNLTDAAFVPVNPNAPGVTIAAKDKISTIDIEQHSPTQAVATPEISNRLSPADGYAESIMTLSGQMPPAETPTVTGGGTKPEIDITGTEVSDIVPVNDKEIVEPKSYTMSIVIILVIIALGFILLKNK